MKLAKKLCALALPVVLMTLPARADQALRAKVGAALVCDRDLIEAYIWKSIKSPTPRNLRYNDPRNESAGLAQSYREFIATVAQSMELVRTDASAAEAELDKCKKAKANTNPGSLWGIGFILNVNDGYTDQGNYASRYNEVRAIMEKQIEGMNLSDATKATLTTIFSPRAHCRQIGVDASAGVVLGGGATLEAHFCESNVGRRWVEFRGGAGIGPGLGAGISGYTQTYSRDNDLMSRLMVFTKPSGHIMLGLGPVVSSVILPEGHMPDKEPPRNIDINGGGLGIGMTIMTMLDGKVYTLDLKSNPERLLTLMEGPAPVQP